ncbi:MAG: hypothetical protein U1F11_04945 [Steroidobacteraceae bacterium]
MKEQEITGGWCSPTAAATSWIRSRPRASCASSSTPTQRPELPPPSAPGSPIGYVYANNDGDDGDPLTDYDVIGSAQDGTGLFALPRKAAVRPVLRPPLGRDRDVGANAWSRHASAASARRCWWWIRLVPSRKVPARRSPWNCAAGRSARTAP